jgi:DNA-binding NarL/FixJ family response regulator
MPGMDDGALTILVADDHTLFRDGLRQVLGQFDPHARVVEAASLATVCAVLHADPAVALCLIDLHMPGMAGPESLEVIQAVAPRTPLLVISGDDNPAQIEAVRAHGAAGFVAKTASIPALLEALRAVLAGEACFPQTLVVPPPGGHRLTERQVAILRLMAQGASNKEIANSLGIALQTVKNHGATILRLLNARNRTAAVQAALRLGLIGAPAGPP